MELRGGGGDRHLAENVTPRLGDIGCDLPHSDIQHARRDCAMASAAMLWTLALVEIQRNQSHHCDLHAVEHSTTMHLGLTKRAALQQASRQLGLRYMCLHAFQGEIPSG